MDTATETKSSPTPNGKSCEQRLPSPLLAASLPGTRIPAYEGHSLDSPPPWMDRQKLAVGQEFARKHLLPILIGHFFSMMCIFVWEPIFLVVLYTRNLESIQKATRRNFGNLVYFLSWYLGDMWDPSDNAHQTMKKVQKMHQLAGVSSNQNEEQVRVASADMSLEPDIRDSCQSWRIIRRELSYQPKVSELLVPEKIHYVSQVDHIITVLGLVSPVMVTTDRLGVHGASKEELEGFAHLWKVIGYHMGLQDQFNPCRGSLEEVQARCQDLVDGVVYPAFKKITQEEEYIMRVSIESMFQKIKATSFLTFDVITLFMLWVFQIRVPGFYQQMPWQSKANYWLLRGIAGFALRVPFVLQFLNYLVRWQVTRVTQKKNKTG